MNSTVKILAAGAEKTVRLPPDIMAWLEAKATANQWSLDTAIIVPIRLAMENDPLKIYVCELAVRGMSNYAVTVGDGGECIFAGDDRKKAIDAARAKVTEFGMATSSIIHKTL